MENGDRQDWAKFSLSYLERAYGKEAPDYLPDLIRDEASTMLQLDFLENEAELRSKEVFEDYLANVPDAEPVHAEDLIK